jgi:hypothetical protein
MLPKIRTHRPIRGRRDRPLCKDCCARDLPRGRRKKWSLRVAIDVDPQSFL